MICPKCRCEVGNAKSCPYCGTVFYQDPMQDYTQKVIRQDQPAPSGNQDRHASNIDTWGLVSVVLLSGIFISEVLQLVLMLAN
jgi:hypothetical protein